MIKKITICMLLVLLVFGIEIAFAGVETVKDNNDGNQGYILVNTGTKNGNSDVGHWTDSSFLKGDKGDTGQQGIAGYTPIKGVDYFDGINGVDGIGVDGRDGLDGTNGIDGYTPVKGVDYFDGLNGLSITGEKGNQGLTGENGLAGKDGKDIDPQIVTDLQNKDNTLQENINIEQFNRIHLGNDLQNNINSETTNRINTNNKLQDNINNTNSRIDDTNSRVSKLEGTQYNLRSELKFIRQKNIEVGLYNVFNSNRKTVSEVGINIVVGIGESYQDKENKRINMRLNNIEKKLGATTIIEKTLDSRGNIKSISISSGKVAVGGAF